MDGESGVKAKIYTLLIEGMEVVGHMARQLLIAILHKDKEQRGQPLTQDKHE